ncbi:calcitonin gene-related peptide type 1 receptor-like [Ylistrum balloti]|uniref:calcitonin gene-related peptide type 1 receptor-like n=1 Tax=Ylistrum balloti TaxID=509963 RepID=UPI002905E3CC|nr:calcitonin gene-related peptide type 1 receptor-like [Ylistrum balloti]
MLITVKGEERTCHYKFGAYHPQIYDMFTCAWCYTFLFPKRGLTAHPGHPFLFLTSETGRIQARFNPDAKNDTARTEICRTLTDEQCQRWQSCCFAAHDCCEEQLSLPPPDNSTCQATWDGYGCWGKKAPSTVNYMNCPLYMSYSIPTRQAEKICLPNATWLMKTGMYWTDYTSCSNYKDLKTSLYLGMGCSIFSVIVLVPAIYIFVRYKALRKQHRIRLHINFFLALLLKEVMTILWDMLVTYDRLSHEDAFNTILVQNGVGCKVLSFFMIYFKCTSFTWMFCEGFYLHRLMSDAFSPPRSLITLYVTGWGIPLLSSTIYAIIRGIYANESCWSTSYEDKEWIFYAPNLACLIVNFIFLCNILRILLTQLQSHPNEPSNFRKAVKATFVLIPLFGVQLFVTIYRIPVNKQAGLEYERFSLFCNNLQGFFVALIFCFLNSEVSDIVALPCSYKQSAVITHLRKTWRRRIRDRSFGGSKRLHTSLNQTLSFNTDTLDRKSSDKRNRKENYQMDDKVNGDIVSNETRGNDIRYNPVPVTDEQYSLSDTNHEKCMLH